MRYGPEYPEVTYVKHKFAEETYDTGEVLMNFSVVGSSEAPAIVLIPGQSESWWGYESVMTLLADDFQVFAVDLRGQGRSTRTPGRYTVDNLGNDLVRFLGGVVGRPAIVAGNSSGGVVAAWLSAYAPVGAVRAALYEDPPLFAGETRPPYGQSASQSVAQVFAVWHRYLGSQWSVGDWAGLRAAAASELPDWLKAFVANVSTDEPAQQMKEYDPEWGLATWSGTLTASVDHRRMLSSVKVPVLFTHHARPVDEATGHLMGAISDLQASKVQELVSAAGQRFTYRSFPTMGHVMHSIAPEQYVETLREWVATLGEQRRA
jgi:pimeloyl-ACP methyl ester carboxylesterase